MRSAPFPVKMAIEIWSRRLDSHQHQPPLPTLNGAKPVPSYLATSAKHECKDSNPVRQFWRLTALPGAHSYCQKGIRRESNPPRLSKH